MPRLAERPDTYFTTVRGLCRACREVRPARVFFRQGKVFQQTLCPSCDNRPTLVAADVEWYLRQTVAAFPDRSPLPESHPPRHGCPRDCGPCSWHASPCQLPVVPITNVCDLRCPICFTHNRPDRSFFMSADEMQATVEWIVRSSGRVDLVNLTGGEPTLHPRLLDLIDRCRRPEIGRITVNSNGLRLASDRGLCDDLAERGVHVVLSLDTFDPGVSRRLHGRDLVEVKRRALENLTAAGVRTTLLLVLVRDTNEGAVGDLLRLMRDNDLVLSLVVQTMTYTGQGGGHFMPRDPIPVDEAARIVCAQSDDDLRFEDFLPRAGAHPLCYLNCYALKSGDRLLPLTRLAEPQQIRATAGESYLPRLEQTQQAFLRDAVDRLHARGDRATLALVRRTIEALYPPDRVLDAFERQRRAECTARLICVHAHMDEDTFDCTRAMLCPDLVPTAPGRLVPACTYNLFYRQQDERFYARSDASASH